MRSGPKRKPEPLIPDPVIEHYKKGVNRELIRYCLSLTVEERFERMMRMQRMADEMRRAGRDPHSRSNNCPLDTPFVFNEPETYW